MVIKQRILRVTRSPLNPRRWELHLACQHHVWITQLTKPTRREMVCPVCPIKLRYSPTPDQP
jgi:hypothetical protein